MSALKPCPVPLARQIRSTRSVVVHRQLDCRFYETCLDHSVQMKWESFSCIRCPLRATADRPSDAPAFAQQRRGHPAV